MTNINKNIPIQNLDIPLERDIFFRTIISELSGQLEDLIGLEEASGFISVVGQKIGTDIDEHYKKELKAPQLNNLQISEVLTDLKSRIGGDFYVISQDNNKIVLGNNACPFGNKVKGRPSLCMMTSNVFGTIAAESGGFAKVVLKDTIALGAPKCKVNVYLNLNNEAESAEGREYYQAGE